MSASCTGHIASDGYHRGWPRLAVGDGSCESVGEEVTKARHAGNCLRCGILQYQGRELYKSVLERVGYVDGDDVQALAVERKRCLRWYIAVLGDRAATGPSVGWMWVAPGSR